MACNHKHFVDLPDGRRVAVPCGFCAVCRASRRDEWQKRLEIEQLYNERQGYGSTFLTLTVDDDHLIPLGQEKRTCQLFFKRVRKSSPVGANPHFKYFLVSEYGSTTGRLHFHAIVLGLDFALHAKVFRSCWPLGFVSPLPVRAGAIRYVLKYIEKTQSTAREAKIYADRGLTPPFRLISKGIGLQFFKDNQFRLIESDGMYFWHGRSVLAPEYVRRKLGIRPSIDLSADVSNKVHNSKVFEENLIQRQRNSNDPVFTYNQADLLTGRKFPQVKH